MNNNAKKKVIKLSTTSKIIIIANSQLVAETPAGSCLAAQPLARRRRLREHLTLHAHTTSLVLLAFSFSLKERERERETYQLGSIGAAVFEERAAAIPKSKQQETLR